MGGKKHTAECDVCLLVEMGCVECAILYFVSYSIIPLLSSRCLLLQ